MDEAKKERLAFLRRIHKSYWVGAKNELEKLEAVHEKWLHPARSDRRKYTKTTAYWNGDLT